MEDKDTKKKTPEWLSSPESQVKVKEVWKCIADEKQELCTVSHPYDSDFWVAVALQREVYTFLGSRNGTLDV